MQLNDEAVSRFRRTNVRGPLRIGLPTDYAVSFLQSAVTNFLHGNQAVEVEIQCDVSRNLLADLHADRLDLAVALITEAHDQYLVRAWEEQPIWAAHRTQTSTRHSRCPW